jgi:hypothetical protein
MWFEPGDPTLQYAPGPDDYYAQKVYLVCWEYMNSSIRKPPCPHCQSAQRVSRNGWDSQGRLVYAEHSNYYLVGFQYICRACEASGTPHVFAPWHPGVVSQLPRELQESLPCVVYTRSALDIKLVEAMEAKIVGGMGFQTLEDQLMEGHKNEYMRRMNR